MYKWIAALALVASPALANPPAGSQPHNHDHHGHAAHGGEQAAPKGTLHRGAPFTVDAKAEIDLDQIAASPDKFTGKAVRVKGNVDKVCQAKGCWMALKGPSGKHSARITFKDYAFFVPKDIMGRTASVEGTVELKKLSKAMREHLAKDEGTDIANVPEVELRMVATGVEIM